MGGSSSKQDVKSKDIKNYMKDENIHKEAEERNIDPALLAYSRQKQDKIDNSDALRQRGQLEK